MGHSVEMASASDVTIHIKAYDIPLFDDVIEAAQMGLVPAASYRESKSYNRRSSRSGFGPCMDGYSL